MRTVVTSTTHEFFVHASLDAYQRFRQGEIRVFSRGWDESIPRDLV